MNGHIKELSPALFRTREEIHMITSYREHLHSPLSKYHEKVYHVQKEIQGIEELKASRYWHLFTPLQKERWDQQLHSLRRILVAQSTLSAAE